MAEKTIAELSDDLVTSLRRGREAIIGRGGTIGTTSGFADFPSAIYNIPADNAIATEINATSASAKSVPANSTKYAYLAELGGMTYKCNNLIPFPYNGNGAGYTTTVRGVTFTVREDGGVLAKGTAEGNASFILSNTNPFIAGKTYSWSKRIYIDYRDASGVVQYPNGTVTWKDEYTLLNIYIQVLNETIDEVIYPMLNEGSTALPYEPYFEGLRDTKVTEIVSKGVNLYDGTPEFELNGNQMNKTIFNTPIEGDVVLSWKIDGTTPNAAALFSVTLIDGSEVNVPTKYSTVYVAKGIKRIKLVNWLYMVGKVYDIQLNLGTNVLPYTPYRAPISYPIPDKILGLPGYGEGININYYNKVDLVNKKYIRRCYRVIVDGVNNMFTYSTIESGYRYCSFVVNKEPLKNSNRVICSHLEYGSFKFQPGYCYMLPAQGSVICFLQDQTITSAAAANVWAKEQYDRGIPFEVVYIANETEEIDLPVELNPLIAVEGGGTIEFVSEYGYAVPSKVIYQKLTQ